MKKLLGCILFLSFSVFALAQDSFTQEEIKSLFIQDSKPLELVALSNEEMKTTEGAWLPLFLLRVGVGLTVNHLTYLNAPGPKDPIYYGGPFKLW